MLVQSCEHGKDRVCVVHDERQKSRVMFRVCICKSKEQVDMMKISSPRNKRIGR